MSKKAFVIMPFAKDMNRVYTLIINPALTKMNYECVRQDLSSEGGYVIGNVIKNIADSDIVIADLSEWNWNVAYELGMRHALSRTGTILICSDVHKDAPKFDIKHLNIIYYPADWSENFGEESIISEITKRIQFIEQNSDSIDSPVHEQFSELPDKIIALSGKTDQLASKAKQLESENKKLRERIAAAGLDETSSSKETDDIEAAITKAMHDSIYYGNAAVSKLDQLSRQDDLSEFGHFLAQVIKRGSLDERQSKLVYNICDSLSMPPLTCEFLERATKQYPNDEELNRSYALSLMRIPSYRDKAVIIANDMIGLSKKNGKYELSNKHVEYETLAAFFSVYYNLRKYEEIMNISPVLLNEYASASTKCLISQYEVRVYLYRDDHSAKAALPLCRNMISIMPNNGYNYYWTFLVFNRLDNYVSAFLSLENGICCDPHDTDYPYMMAQYMFNSQYVRTEAGKPPHIVSDEEVKEYAVPFLLLAARNGRDIKQVVKLLSDYHCENVIKQLQELGLEETMSRQNYEMVEYCLRKDLDVLFPETDE